jgi:hypothetical protein
MARAIRIDIEKELEAINRGECPACRMGSTHKLSKACEQTPAYKRLALCDQEHIYDPNYFSGCPLCHPIAQVIIPNNL